MLAFAFFLIVQTNKDDEVKAQQIESIETEQRKKPETEETEVKAETKPETIVSESDGETDAPESGNVIVKGKANGKETPSAESAVKKMQAEEETESKFWKQRN